MAAEPRRMQNPRPSHDQQSDAAHRHGLAMLAN
jgi:hypothetical protein